MTTYRNFTPADNTSVTGFMKQLYQEDPGGKPMNEAKIANTLHTLTTEPNRGSVMVFEQQGEAVGYALLIYFWSNEFGGNIVIIDELYVAEPFRSQGIATHFIQHLVQQKPAHAVALQLEVTPGNAAALKLYKRLGFVKHKNATYDLEF
jgi:ribosomal protein S18 acetylase RimI-like enzyme